MQKMKIPEKALPSGKGVYLICTRFDPVLALWAHPSASIVSYPGLIPSPFTSPALYH